MHPQIGRFLQRGRFDSTVRSTLSRRTARRVASRVSLSLLTLALALASEALAGAPGPDPLPRQDTAFPAPTLPSVENPVAPATPTASPPAVAAPTPRPTRTPPRLDPSARMLSGDNASEAWTLYFELDSGHRITQRFLLTNAGPGNHNAVAVGHLLEPGREPYRYENGRQRDRWTLSEDRLFFDIAASHLDLHRPNGEVRITKDDIEIRLFFDFDVRAASAAVPKERLPAGYSVEALAIGSKAHGSIHAPWMSAPVETKGRAWLIHSWTRKDEARLLSRRVDLFGHRGNQAFYGLQLKSPHDWESGWAMVTDPTAGVVESEINLPASWRERPAGSRPSQSGSYPTPAGFDFSDGTLAGEIALTQDWLRFDPLAVLPQPFRWFIRRKSQPQEVWADAEIGVSISLAPGPLSVPPTGAQTEETRSAIRESERETRSQRETEDETASSRMTGVASITFLNPMSRR